jgi:hypothetical protein
LPKQIQALRDAENVQGEIYFSSKSFVKNPNGWNDSLQNNYNRTPALIPPMEWIDSTKPAKPIVRLVFSSHYANSIQFNLSLPDSAANIKAFVVYTYPQDSSYETNAKIYKIIPAGREAIINLPYFEMLNKKIVITAVGRNNNESDFTFVNPDDSKSSTTKN